jgi:hypothetical protein
MSWTNMEKCDKMERRRFREKKLGQKFFFRSYISVVELIEWLRILQQKTWLLRIQIKDKSIYLNKNQTIQRYIFSINCKNEINKNLLNQLIKLYIRYKSYKIESLPTKPTQSCKRKKEKKTRPN